MPKNPETQLQRDTGPGVDHAKGRRGGQNPCRDISTTSHHKCQAAPCLRSAPNSIQDLVEDGDITSRAKQLSGRAKQSKVQGITSRAKVRDRQLQSCKNQSNKLRRQRAPGLPVSCTCNPVQVRQQTFKPRIPSEARATSTGMSPTLVVTRVSLLSDSLQPFPGMDTKQGDSVLKGVNIHAQNMASPSPLEMQNTNKQRRQAPAGKFRTNSSCNAQQVSPGTFIKDFTPTVPRASPKDTQIRKNGERGRKGST